LLAFYLVRGAGQGKTAPFAPFGLPERRVFAGLPAHDPEKWAPVFGRDHAPKQGAWRPSMTPFFVQIKCELGKSYQVANELAEAEIASEIYSTAGDYDLLVKFYVDSGTDIGHFVSEKVQSLPGIKDTYTIITFKAFQA
jgi:DNA-binding Lrp family transcriptional regulator